MPFTFRKFLKFAENTARKRCEAQPFMNPFMRRSFHWSPILTFSPLRHRITSDVAKRIPHWQIFDSPPPIWVVDFFVIKQLVSQPCPRFCIAGLGAWRRNIIYFVFLLSQTTCMPAGNGRHYLCHVFVYSSAVTTNLDFRPRWLRKLTFLFSPFFVETFLTFLLGIRF